jgi:nicotinamide phosphoribosyltransferase
MNIILNVDSYKCSHYLQYPPETKNVSSYIEARGGAYPYTTFFGLQAFLKTLRPVTLEDIEEAESYIVPHGLPFNKEGWLGIVNHHGGHLPLRIQAVPEGMNLPIRNAVVQVTNTDPRYAWLPSYVETPLLRAVWYPTTVSTRSYWIKQLILQKLRQTGCDEAAAKFMLHDFGPRGVSSEESAALGGMGHLVNFLGTDNLSALVAARKFYGEHMAGFSIPAAEHSTITSWAAYDKKDGEIMAFKHMLDTFLGPDKIVAVVSDSYDIYRACDEYWGTELKDVIEKSGGRLVVRPDSGDPCIVPIECIEKLGAKFGYTLNRLGYKVLPPCIRVIQGDGINEGTIDAILCELKSRRWAAENIVFGMGGEMLQTMNRDTQKWAMKASAIKIGDSDRLDVQKDPITDPGKKSKAGRLALVCETGIGNASFITVPEHELGRRKNYLEDVWVNGELLRDQTFEQVRAQSQSSY